MCARAQQPFSGLHQHSPMLLVMSETPPDAALLYIDFGVYADVENLLTELVRKACSNELQRALFQHGTAMSAYGKLACLTHLSFTAHFDTLAYRREVHSALHLKYATKQYPTFDAWLFHLCMRIAFFNTAFYNSECCAGAELVDMVHALLGTSPLTKATIAQSFTRGPDNRLQLFGQLQEKAYFDKVKEFLSSMNSSGDGTTVPIGVISASGGYRSSHPGTGAATHGRRELACRKCGRGHDECVACEFCLTCRCDHSEDACPHVKVSAADASRPDDRYICPRCKRVGDHYASQCKFLSLDLLKQRFRGKSLQEVNAMRKRPGGERSQRNRKQSVASFGAFFENGEVKRVFKKVGNLAAKDPAIRSRVVAHLLATMGSSASDPALEKSTTVTAAATQAEIDMEFVRSLELQFAAQSLQADQSRVRK